MKLLLTALAAFLLAGFAHYRQPAKVKRSRSFVSCAPNRDAFDPATNNVPLLPGWGAYRMPVTKTNDSSYIYFEQGINLYYGFHIIEALASFDKSTRFDSSFAMGYWGVALAYGPNINDDGYTASPKALAAAQKAKALQNNSTPQEKALIAAMQTRYSNDTTQSRQQLDQAYVDAMAKAYSQFKEDQDIGALYADAMMQQHPWDLYDRWGKAKSWTPPIVTTLEAVLKENPAHPGAAHYYIHAVEASDHPERALEVSDELPTLMPGVAHLVHMPAHIFIRTGNYNKGWIVNADAVKGYKDYLSRYPAVEGNSPLYLIHNLHMQATCAIMDGRYKDALQTSIDTRNSFDSSLLSMPGFFGTFVQYVYMFPLYTQVRFGKWDSILNTPAISSNYIYASILTHFARGIAFARKGRINEAETEWAALRADTVTGNAQLISPAPNYANPGINGARVAEKILAGVIAESKAEKAESKQDYKRSIVLFQQAAELEDGMIYNEPKDWLMPARQFLGNVQLKAGRYKNAETTFQADLKANPQNGWSYTGLATAFEKQGKQKDAAAARALAQKAFARSDTKITASVLP
jgi:tetratricopeptide (TPR) repeat protein